MAVGGCVRASQVRRVQSPADTEEDRNSWIWKQRLKLYSAVQVVTLKINLFC